MSNRTNTPKAALAAIILACVLLTTTSPAATDKSGIIAGERWTKAMSPIRVIGDITVFNLIIDPGVEIVFTGNFEFDCPGVLEAQGAKLDMISFHGDTGVTWKGIKFLNSIPGSVLDYCSVQNSADSGIRITDSFPAISRCEIKNNSATLGGGVNIVLNVPGALTLEGCKGISNNTSTGGGGVYVLTNSANAVVRFIDSDFIDNLAQNVNLGGGGAFIGGAGKCELLRCVFRGNQATGSNTYGGGVYLQSGSLSLRNCDLQSNSVGGSGYYVWGGGICVGAGNASLYNCCIRQNGILSGTTRRGGGMALLAGTVLVENCTIVSNLYDGIITGTSTLTVINSIIYFNNANGTQVEGIAAITYSDVQNGYTGVGNINYNPMLEETDGYGLKISNYSLCKDAGNPDPICNDSCFYAPDKTPWGSYGTARNDMGAHGGPGAALWEPGSGPPKVSPPSGGGLIGNGDTITLKVSVSGIPPFTFLWKKDGVPITDNPPHITGVTTDTLTITNATSADDGVYTVDVTNAFTPIPIPSSGATIAIDPLRVNVKMFAGVIIQAEPGKTVRIEYSNDLSSGSWTTLTQFVLPSSPYTYYDADSPYYPKRFYRAVSVP